MRCIVLRIYYNQSVIIEIVHSKDIMPKRKCSFSDEYTKEWSFIKKGRNDHEALCSICGLYISVSHGGKSSVKDHIQSKNHKSRLSVASTSKNISSFMIKQNSTEDTLICAAELTTAYKVVKHHHSPII